MRKLKLFFACLLMTVVSIGQVWGAEELKATLDFTNGGWGIPTSGTNTSQASFTKDGITIKLAASTNYKQNSGYLILGKSNSTLELPAFTWKTTKILVTGTSGASASVKQNIFVGNDAVSTETTGAQNVTNTYEIASASQAAGTIYVFKVTSAHNTQITTIQIYGEASEDPDPDPVSVTGVTLDKSEAEVAVGKTVTLVETVAPGNATNKTVSWESDDETVATVADGVVTGVAEGTATITVTTEDGSFTADCEVTVNPAPAAVNYEKVTSEPADWSGEYILVYEADATNARVWKGADQANNYAEATIADGVIAAPEGAAVLNIAKVAESDPVVYTIMLGEKYIGQTSDANGIKIQDAAINNSISYNGTDAAVDIVASSAHLRYNSASSSYFRYYKSSSYSSQKKIQLYKKVDGTVKPSAELSYATADQKKLTKLGDAFTAPELSNPHSVAVSYASNNTDVAEVASNGAVTIKAVGVAVITASYDGSGEYKEGSASYTIYVATEAGTAEDPLSEASAKALIDLGCTMTAHVNGLVLSQNTTNYTVTLTNGFQFYKAKDIGNVAFESAYLAVGDEVTAYGQLTKYSSTYELAEGCYLTFYEQATATLTPIANDKDHPYTVAQALAFAAAPTTYDLSDHVFIQGEVYKANSFNEENGTYNIYIKDAGTSESDGKFEFYKCAGLYQVGESAVPFAEGDVQVGNIVIGYGVMTWYSGGSIWQFGQPNQLVDLQAPITGVDLAATAEVEVGSTVNLTATILPSNAAAATIDWTVESGDDYASVDAGVVSGIAEGEATIRATVQGTEIYAECTVTVTPEAAPVSYDYALVTDAAQLQDGLKVIIVASETDVAAGSAASTYRNVVDVERTSEGDYLILDSENMPTEFTLGVPAAGQYTFHDGDGYMYESAAKSVKVQADPFNWSITIGEGNIATIQATNELRYNTSSPRFTTYASGQQALQLYVKDDGKQPAGLAWSTSAVELTVGDAFTAPTLTNPNSLTVTIASNNTELATVSEGVVSLVEDATGEATITATFAGNDDYRAASVSYTITVNSAHSIYVSPGLNVNFGSVTKDAEVEDKVITVTLTGVPAATATLEGTGASAFSYTPVALTASGDITISASSATAGTFAATLTISDDAGLAASKVVNLSLTVNEPSAEETPISTSTQWVAATAADLVDGAEVIITGVKDEVVYAMGDQKSTNRAGYLASVDGEGVLTPGEGTMSFTLVAQEAEGVFALRTSAGKYLYAAASGSNHLKTQDDVDVNAKWTLSVTSAVAEGSTNRNIMRFNGSGTNNLFSCYSSGQTEIKFYVPKPETPEPPVENWEDGRTGLTQGKYYTICLPKKVKNFRGASIWNLEKRNTGGTEVYLEEAKLPFAAGTPFIIQATADKLEVVYEGDATSTPVESGALRGTLTGLDVDAFAALGGDIYILKDNAIRPRTAGNWLSANRAYIDYDELEPVSEAPTSMPGKKVKRMPMQGQTTTGCELINAAEAPAKMMINGQLFILRGDKMYDTTGRLVK